MKIEEMTDEQMRFKIAEHCGLKPFHGVVGRIMGIFAKDATGDTIRLPDYVVGLDAMHFAEEALPPVQMVRYIRELRDVLWDNGENGDDVENMVRATARQRAIAFLRAVGKGDA